MGLPRNPQRILALGSLCVFVEDSIARWSCFQQLSGQLADGRYRIAQPMSSTFPKHNKQQLSSTDQLVQIKVSGFSQDDAESLLHNLANKFGGDLAATDSTRVLRLPGFANRKLPEEFIVQARQESDAVHTLRDFTIDEDSPETQRHLGDYGQRERKVRSGHKSQSEQDWAYAKRALARGDDPEVVIQRIADYRVEDKDDPNYYARHTVAKAQSELLRQSGVQTSVDVDPTQGKGIRIDH